MKSFIVGENGAVCRADRCWQMDTEVCGLNNKELNSLQIKAGLHNVTLL